MKDAELYSALAAPEPRPLMRIDERATPHQRQSLRRCLGRLEDDSDHVNDHEKRPKAAKEH